MTDDQRTEPRHEPVEPVIEEDLRDVPEVDPADPVVEPSPPDDAPEISWAVLLPSLVAQMYFVVPSATQGPPASPQELAQTYVHLVTPLLTTFDLDSAFAESGIEGALTPMQRLMICGAVIIGGAVMLKPPKLGPKKPRPQPETPAPQPEPAAA